MTNDVGRPKKTLDDLPTAWKEIAIEMGREGAMDIHIRIDALGHISNDLWTRLMKEEPEFSETITQARELSEYWWKGKPAKNLQNRDFNTNLFGKVMANKFDWRDKGDVTSKGETINAIVTTYQRDDD